MIFLNITKRCFSHATRTCIRPIVMTTSAALTIDRSSPTTAWIIVPPKRKIRISSNGVFCITAESSFILNGPRLPSRDLATVLGMTVALSGISWRWQPAAHRGSTAPRARRRPHRRRRPAIRCLQLGRSPSVASLALTPYGHGIYTRQAVSHLARDRVDSRGSVPEGTELASIRGEAYYMNLNDAILNRTH